MIKNKGTKIVLHFIFQFCTRRFKSLPLSMSYASLAFRTLSLLDLIRGTQQERSSKPLKHSIVKRILVFKR